MATDFTQDAVLHFLQSSGGSVKNSDLLLHFRNFLRNHEDQDRNRDLFKKFVNSVATVRQQDGVSHVVLRKKFRGHVPRDGAAASSGPRRHPDWKSSGDCPESCGPEDRDRDRDRLKPAAGREGPEDQAPRTTSQQRLPAAGIIHTEGDVKVKKQQHGSTSGASTTSGLSPVSTTSGLSAVSTTSRVSDVSTTSGLSAVSTTSRVSDVSTRSGLSAVSTTSGVSRALTSGLSAVSTTSELSSVSTTSGLSGVSTASGLSPMSTASGLSPMSTTSGLSPMSTTSGLSSMSTTSGVSSVSSAQLVSQVSEKSPGVCEPPAPVSQQRTRSEGPAGRRHVEDQQEVPVLQTLRGRDARSQTEGGVHQPPARRFRYRPSYKSAVSCDEDEDEEEEEEVMERRGPAGAAWPQGVPLGDTGRVVSTSLPCIIDTPVPPRGVSSSERIVPKISIQDAEGAALPPPEPGAGLTGRWTGTGHMADWTEAHLAPSKQASAQHSVQQQAAGVHLERTHLERTHLERTHLERPQSPAAGASPSHRSVLSPSPGSGWSSSSYEDLQARAGDSPDDHKEAVSSEGSVFSPLLRQRPGLGGRLGSQVRSRMCLSLGADLDKVLQEEEEEDRRSRGSEAARLNRLHLISSSLSLGYNLSSSSLSSCSTPPRCRSLADLAEGGEPRMGRRSLPAPAPTTTTAHHDSPSKQSLVPLEPREHAWLVKGATGAWPDIYSLFREDSSLLNKQDFISGFTVLHWIAKHGDHRVLNTLWYGVQKAGLMFDINARSACGHTPLHIAAIHGHKNIIRLLVNKFEADVKLRDTAGKRPWQYLNGNTPVDVFQLLEAPARAAVGGVRRADNGSWEQQHHQRRRRRHHLSTASGERPLTIAGTAKVKRSSSIAALLKHKSLRRFYGHQSDSAV